VIEGQLGLEVEDLLQELYCRLLSAGRSGRFLGRTDAELGRYLRQAAISVVADRRRALRTDKRNVSVPSLEEDATRRWLEERPPTCPEEETPEGRYRLREARRTFSRHCDELARSQRAAKLGALRLTLLNGCSSREVARRLGGALTPAQVDRLVAKLRRRLHREGIALPRRRGWSRPSGGASARARPRRRTPAEPW
jgi:RNA polymerase sigma factor (sigma-70 family)